MPDVLNDNAVPSWLETSRREAGRAARTLPMPALRYGLGVFFTPAETGLDAAFATAVVGAAAVRADGARVMSFAEAAEDERLERIVRERVGAAPRDKADALRVASAEGTVVDVPAGARVRVTVTLPRAAVSADHVIVVAGPGSDVDIVERAADGPTGTLRLGRTDIVVGEGATVRATCVADRDDASRELVRRTAVVGRDGVMRWTEAVFGGAYVRWHASTSLVGGNARNEHRVAFIGRAEERFDLRQETVHFASGTASDIISRGALADDAKTVYRGLIRMHRGTRSVTGSQKEDTLLLSPRAQIDAMPDLEIATDDVRCGHSASAGRLDDEKLFYLRSRGISRAEAARMTVKGFFAAVLDDAGDARDLLERELDARIDDLTV